MLEFVWRSILLLSKFWLNNHLQVIEYEGLHMICFECGKYGHRAETCSRKQKESVGGEGSNGQ